MPNKISKILKIFISSLLIGQFCVSVSYAEEQSQSGLNVETIRDTSNGIMVGFSTLPVDCSGSYLKGHAYLSNSVKGFYEIRTRLMTARAINQSVTVYYKDIGNCSDLLSTLQLSNVEL